MSVCQDEFGGTDSSRAGLPILKQNNEYFVRIIYTENIVDKLY